MDAHFCPTVQILSINISIFMLLDISLYKQVVTLLFLGITFTVWFWSEGICTAIKVFLVFDNVFHIFLMKGLQK